MLWDISALVTVGHITVPPTTAGKQFVPFKRSLLALWGISAPFWKLWGLALFDLPYNTRFF